MDKSICELFAGVGGFRLGFERLNSGWETVWFSQWEPNAVSQWAHNCYVTHFGDRVDLKGEYHTCEDISVINKDDIPDHAVLVGGFPCQDYSVAQSLSTSKGIEGKKGVLWWQIRDVLISKRPPFCILENVDRLVKSPTKQRGRDFGIILACFYELGYNVEWRIVNSAMYGSPQRRRRTFIFAYRTDTVYGKKMSSVSADNVITKEGFMVKAFPIFAASSVTTTTVGTDILNVSETFSFNFKNAGCMSNGVVTTSNVLEAAEEPVSLRSVLQRVTDEKYYIHVNSLSKWAYLKGTKNVSRTSKSGHEYIFSEGPVPFPDPWNKPGRTMLTSESTVSRSTHVVADPETGCLRVLTPIEAERLQGFTDDWTNTGMSDRMRYFCMGNSLVVPMVTRMAKVLDEIIEKE